MGNTDGSVSNPFACQCLNDDAYPGADIIDTDEGDLHNSKAMINHKLLAAARDGDIAGIQRSVERGAFVDIRRPFFVAPESSLPRAQSATTSPHSLRDTGLTPLMYAAHGGHEKACELLLDLRACIDAQDEDGMTPLHFAASAGSSEACRVLINAGTDVNARDDDDQTPLQHVPQRCLLCTADKHLWETIFQAGQLPTVPEAAPSTPDEK